MTDVRDADLTDILDTPSARGDVVLPGGQLPGGRPGRGTVVAPARRLLALRFRWRPLLRLLLFMVPTIVASTYYGLIASDRYLSTASFIIRSASKPSGDTGLGAILRMAGLGRAEDDTYSVQSFLLSRDAVQQLKERLPLAQMYGLPGIDALSRFPSILYGDTNEQLFKYYSTMTSAPYNATTGVTTLNVQAFRPDDALAIATNLLTLAENLVNQLNTRIREDAVVAAQAEVKHQEDRLTTAQVALTAFQNKETMIDPINNSLIVSQVVGKLQTDLAQTQARIADMSASAPNNPSLPALKRQADVTQKQISEENARVTSAKEGLADKLGQYQRLMLEREFATKALSIADTSLDTARSEARRKQLYIERIVEPNLSDKSTLPLRGGTIFTVAFLNLFAIFLVWMLTVGVKEHVSSMR